MSVRGSLYCKNTAGDHIRVCAHQVRRNPKCEEVGGGHDRYIDNIVIDRSDNVFRDYRRTVEVESLDTEQKISINVRYKFRLGFNAAIWVYDDPFDTDKLRVEQVDPTIFASEAEEARAWEIVRQQVATSGLSLPEKPFAVDEGGKSSQIVLLNVLLLLVGELPSTRRWTAVLHGVSHTYLPGFALLQEGQSMLQYGQYLAHYCALAKKV